MRRARAACRTCSHLEVPRYCANSRTLGASNPSSCAVTNWSALRRTVRSPGVTGDVVERVIARILRRAGPEQRRSVAEIAGAGAESARAERRRRRRPRPEIRRWARWSASRSGSLVSRDTHGVGGQQLQERIVGVGLLGEREQALLEIGKFLFGAARGVAAIQVRAAGSRGRKRWRWRPRETAECAPITRLAGENA